VTEYQRVRHQRVAEAERAPVGGDDARCDPGAVAESQVDAIADVPVELRLRGRC
jgi:hypothetical protein